MQRINTQSKYEYKVLGFEAYEFDRIDAILTEQGQRGWKVIHVYTPGSLVNLWRFVLERVERFAPGPGELFDTPLKNADDVIAAGKWHIGRRTLEELMDFCSREGVFSRFQEGKFSFAFRPDPKPEPATHHTIPLVLDGNSSPFVSPVGYVVSDIPEGLMLLADGLRVKKGYEVKAGQKLEVKGIGEGGYHYVTFKPVERVPANG